MSRPDDPANFARIDMTQRECEAIREIRTFMDELGQAPVTTDKRGLAQYRLSLRRACESLGRYPRNAEMTPVDLTKDECDAICDCGEFFEELIADEFRRGVVSNPRLDNFRVVLSRVRMKCRAASEIIKPNISTDPRLS